MAWHRFAAGLLRQDDPEHLKVLYWDDGPLHAGELLLWLDEGGDVARFLLSHRPFGGPREHCVEWQRGGAPRFGEVDDGEGAGRGKMAPIVHFGRANPAARAELQAYFAANAAALEPAQGATVAAVLEPAPGATVADVFGHGMGPPPGAVPLPGVVTPRGAPGRRRGDPRHAGSGKGGGMGDGTAATRKGATR